MIIQLLATGAQVGPMYSYNMAVFRHEESVAAFAAFAVTERTKDDPLLDYPMTVEHEDESELLVLSSKSVNGTKTETRTIAARMLSAFHDEEAQWHIFAVSVEDATLLLNKSLLADWRLTEAHDEMYRAWERRFAAFPPGMTPEGFDCAPMTSDLVSRCARRALLDEIGRLTKKGGDGIRVVVVRHFLVSATEYFVIGRDAWLPAVPTRGDFLIDRGQAWGYELDDSANPCRLSTPNGNLIPQYASTVLRTTYDVATADIWLWISGGEVCWDERDLGETAEHFIGRIHPNARILSGPFAIEPTPKHTDT
jgi:hypothetical protein